MIRLMPCGHKIIVQPDELERTHDVVKDDGSVIQLELVNHNERATQAAQITGTIVAIGPQAWKSFREVDENGKWVNGMPWAGIGDKVYYSRHCGHLIENPEFPDDDDKRLLLLNDEDVNAIIIEEVA